MEPAWGLTAADVRPLDSERDLNALVDGRYVLRGAGTESDPYQVTWELLGSAEPTAEGQKLYDENCAACHGSDGQGGKGFPDLRNLSSVLWGRDPETMAETIRAGIEAVPKGQMEASRSLGMSYARAMATIRSFSVTYWRSTRSLRSRPPDFF